MLSVYRSHGVVKKDSRGDNFNKTAENRNIYQLVDKGWLIVNRMKAWQGSVGISDHRGIVSGHYICFRPRHNEDPRFLNHLLRSSAYTLEYARLSRGVRPNQIEIDNELLRALPIRLPSTDEQRRIADFLDAETARIDKLLDAEQRAGLLVIERNRALIESVLTEASVGLVRLKRLLSEPMSYGANAPAEHENQEWPRYIRTTDIANDGSLRPDTFASLPPSVAKGYELREGDLLFVRSGATVGKNLIYRSFFGPAAHAGYLIKARINQKLAMPRFVWYFCQTNSYWAQIAEGAIQATIQNVNAEKYGNLMVPAADIEEQRTVVERLDTELTGSRELASLTSCRVQKLKERRQALITVVVTGQIDVSTASGRGIED